MVSTQPLTVGRRISDVPEVVMSETITSPEQLVEQFIDELDVPDQTAELAEQIAEAITESTWYPGHSPSVVAGASIYIADFIERGIDGDNLKQGKIASVAGCTDRAIGLNYKDIAREVHSVDPTIADGQLSGVTA